MQIAGSDLDEAYRNKYVLLKQSYRKDEKVKCKYELCGKHYSKKRRYQSKKFCNSEGYSYESPVSKMAKIWNICRTIFYIERNILGGKYYVSGRSGQLLMSFDSCSAEK